MKKILPLRIGVGAIVLNDNNHVFVGKRKDNPIDKWQMPQGGVNEGEDYLKAMKRELYEETSIKNIDVLKEFNEWLEYDLPKNLLESYLAGIIITKSFIQQTKLNYKHSHLKYYYNLMEL